MRRFLPLSLCVAATLGLTACDQQPIDGPSTEAEQEFAGFRSLPSVGEIPGYAGNGDISIGYPSSTQSGDDDGIDIILYDIADVAVYDQEGNQIQTIAGNSIISNETGNVTCTMTTSSDGLFNQLRDQDGTVLFSTLGAWTFDGAPELDQRSTSQQLSELNRRLRFSYHSDDIVEGAVSNGSKVAQTSAPVQLATPMRKLLIASLIDGYCGSQGIN